MVRYIDEEDGDEDVMPSTGLPWSLIGEAMGASEQLQVPRSARVRDLEEWECESDEDEIIVDEEVDFEDE